MYPGTHAAVDPDRPAVSVAGTARTLTYGQLEDRSRRLANVLRAVGLGEGDVVALLTDNSPRAFEVYWAALRSGMYVCAVNSHLQADEVDYILTDSGAGALLVSGELAELAGEVRATVAGMRVAAAYDGVVTGYDDLDDLLAGVDDAEPRHRPRGADLLYSSGTTGRPKGVRPVLPERQVDEPGDAVTGLVSAAYGFDADTVYLSPGPIYHAAPLRYCGAVQALGGHVVLMRQFEPEAALRAIEQFRVTHSQWVPTMFVRMLKLSAEQRAAHDLSSHRVAVHAAAPCPVEVKRRMIDWWGPILHEYYAATEGFGMTMIDSYQWAGKPGSVGVPVLGEVHVCGSDGEVLGPDEAGTVFFERDEIGFEYLGDQDKTRSVLHPDHANWATMGDMGYVDADGFLFLTDRKAFTIISGGVNIYPREVEDVLTLHPEVADVAVIGVPDEEMGEAVLAVVQAADGAVAGPELAERLVAHARERIAHYKAPRGVDFVEQLPRTPTGKLVKGDLRARYA